MIAAPIRPAIPQLDQLTGLRGIAAWFVVLYHVRLATTGLFPPTMIDVFAKGYLAVDLFFMLSGFVMWLNYGARLRADGWPGARRFWWKRVARIWPLHLLVLAAMIAFAAVLVATGRSTAGYPFAELPLHILLLQNWGFTADLAWNHPAWSISTELAAYLLFPALVLAARWETMALTSLALVAAFLLAGLHSVFALAGYSELGMAIPQLGLWRCLAGFATGSVLALVWQRLEGGRGRTAVSFGLVSVALAVGGIAADLPETAFVPAAFATGLLALALGTGPFARLLASSPLQWLGDLSYATYLSHFFLFILFKIVFVDDDGMLGAGELGLFLAVVLAASAALFHGFEKPAQRWLNARAPRGFGRDTLKAPS